MRGMVARALEQVAEPVEHAPDDEGADREKGQELHHRLAAMVSISPFWCSPASMRRVPKAMAKKREQQGDGQGQMIRPFDRPDDAVSGDKAETVSRSRKSP